MKKIKEEIKGITLVALVVTIIVLLILSGVAISLSIGEDGIFKRAKEAVELYENASINEQEQLEEINKIIDGEADFEISNKQELEEFRDRVNNGETFEGKLVRVVADIDLENEEWVPIGNYVDNNELKFKGTFEGGNYEIKGLNINSNKDYQGLFGMIENAKVQNVRITSGNIKVGNYGGAISGYGINSTIKNCTNGVEILSSKGYTGGIIGKIDGESVIDSCNNTAKIESTGNCGDEYGNTFLGGIVGRSEAEISNCNNNQEIISIASAVGGISGGQYNKDLKNCTNYGSITVNGGDKSENALVGGIVGRMLGGNNINTIENCHNEGQVIAKMRSVGGIGGSLTNVNVFRCYNIASIETNKTSIGGIIGFLNEGNVKVEECYNLGSITSTHSDNNENTAAGGIVGSSRGEIIKCFNTGDVTINVAIAGGIAGASNKRISQCYNTGKIESNGYNANDDCILGGISGYSTNITEACYNTGEIKGNYKIQGGIVGNTSAETVVKYCYNIYPIEEDSSLRKSFIIGRNLNTENSPVSCYYKGNKTEGESRLEEDMKTQEFIDLIGGNTYWKLDTENKNNGFVILNWQ